MKHHIGAKFHKEPKT